MSDTLNVVPFPPVIPADAVAAGYAEFNRNPTLCIDIPDGGFTLSAKTSEGKRITFAFQPYVTGGPPKCVDIQYHDSGLPLGRNGSPLFDVLLFGEKDYDSRKHGKPGIACVLMDNAL
jgi:hypothetical protein